MKVKKNDKLTTGQIIFSWIFPIYGGYLWIKNKNEKPKKANNAGLIAIISTVLIIAGSIFTAWKKRNNLNSLNGRFENDILDFVKKAIRYPNFKGIFELGFVNANTANKVKKYTGIETKDFKIVLTSDHTRHIIKKHGDSKQESKQGQIAITPEDFIYINEIINKPDIVQDGTNKEENRQHIDSIVLYKIIENQYILVCEVFFKNEELRITTLYKKPL